MLGIAAVFLWAAIPAFVKVGSAENNLSFLLVIRFLIATALFIPIFPKLFGRLKQIPLLFWFGLIVCMAANFYFQGLAMIHLPVSWYLIIFSLNPLFALMLLGVRLTKQGIWGIGLCMLGTFMFVDLDDLSKSYGTWALICLLIGMLTWVVYTWLAKKMQTVFSSFETTALTQAAALLGCTAIWLAEGMPSYQPNLSESGALLALGLLTPVAYFGFTTCLRSMPRFSVVSQYLEPVFGIVIGFMFFAETLSTIQLLGSAMIVFGSVTIEKSAQ
jgi:drug/metabolite transporter (DMT)-like permease